MSLIASDQLRVIIGLGQTGISCARYLKQKGIAFVWADTRLVPPNLDMVKQEFPEVEIHLGPLASEFLSHATEIILSPGVAKDDQAIQDAVKSGAKLIGDIDLFCREVDAPIVAITGSNAKSTVTTLVGEMAKTAGIEVGVGGNLGTPVLDMLNEAPKALYVLELSSFQLETTHELRAAAATILNITPDHLDRYEGMQGYYQAKHRIYRGCQVAVENLDDKLTHPLLPTKTELWGFRLGKPDFKVFGLIEEENTTWLALGSEKLLDTRDLKIPGRHNMANALAALALGKAVDIPMAAMLDTLKTFPGLEHRCQWVATKRTLDFYNDSKGTNVGATVAALEGLGGTLKPEQRIVLVAGGDGKGADFDDLIAPVKQYVRAITLIGKDAEKIRSALPETNCKILPSLQAAVDAAVALAHEGDIVLLSPACASIDMFKNYAQRGQMFVEAVNKL